MKVKKITIQVVCGLLVLVTLLCVLGIAVSGVHGTPKYKNDSLQLSRFASELMFHLNEPENERRRIRIESSELESFRELASALFRERILNLDDMKRLAGTSGLAGDEQAYLNMSEVNAPHSEQQQWNDYCIFTGPSDASILKELLETDTPHCVMFCYNEDWIDRYEYDYQSMWKQNEPALVCVFAGSSEASYLPLGELVELFPDSDLAQRYNAGEKIDLRAVYGKSPFQYISRR